MAMPILYQLPKDVWGYELIRIHEKALELLRDADWQGKAEEQRSGNYKLFAERFHKLYFVFFDLKFYDFLLATINEIEPTKKYDAGSLLVFRVSDVEAIAPMNIRWIEDQDDTAFKKVELFFREYIRALDKVFAQR